MPTPIRNQSIGISLILIGILLLSTCLAYLVYRSIATEGLSDLEQSRSQPLSHSSQELSDRTTTQGISIERNPFQGPGYPAGALAPIDWETPYWSEGLPQNRQNTLYDEYTPIDWDSLPPSNSLPRALRMRIPSIQVDAQVEELALVDLGTARAYETPDKIVGHIPETGHPGGIGNGWYFAHLESALNKEGAIFSDLPLIPEKIRREEPVFVIVDSKTTSYLYQVTETSIKRKEELRVIESSTPIITLVTCIPRLVYDHRLLVTAELMGSKDITP